MKQVLMQYICTRSESTVHESLASAGLPVSWTWPDNASRRIQPGRHVVNICILEVWGTSHSALVIPYQVSGHGLSVAEPTMCRAPVTMHLADLLGRRQEASSCNNGTLPSGQSYQPSAAAALASQRQTPGEAAGACCVPCKQSRGPELMGQCSRLRFASVLVSEPATLRIPTWQHVLLWPRKPSQSPGD